MAKELTPYDDDDDDMMGTMMTCMFMVILVAAMVPTIVNMVQATVAAQGVLAQGLNEPYSLTAKATTQELTFSQAMQSVMITNDGATTVYAKINSLNAKANEVRAGETLELDYNTHVIDRVFYYTISGQSNIRITGTG